MTSSILCLACFQNQCFMDDTAKFSRQFRMSLVFLDHSYSNFCVLRLRVGSTSFLRQSLFVTLQEWKSPLVFWPSFLSNKLAFSGVETIDWWRSSLQGTFPIVPVQCRRLLLNRANLLNNYSLFQHCPSCSLKLPGELVLSKLNVARISLSHFSLLTVNLCKTNH